MSRKHYLKDDPKFAKAANANPGFRPRFHLFYTQREAEQDAYFWFLQGQRAQMDDEMIRAGMGHIAERLRKAVP